MAANTKTPVLSTLDAHGQAGTEAFEDIQKILAKLGKARTRLALEQRLVFDAAAAATGAEVAADLVAQDQAETAAESLTDNSSAEQESSDSSDGVSITGQNALSGEADNSGHTAALSLALSDEAEEAGDISLSLEPTEVLFIDGSVPNVNDLLSAIPPSVEVFILDPNLDGVEQIASALEGRTGIDAIHIISHGDSAQLNLGSATLTTESMRGEHADELAIIGAALSDHGDILVYGCNFGEGDTGKYATDLLAELTGADVASSDDLTGSDDLGGDWELEVLAGEVEAKAFVVGNWDNVLATGAAAGIESLPDGQVRGEDFSFTVNVDNTGTVGDIGYFPFVDVWMPEGTTPPSGSLDGNVMTPEAVIKYDLNGNPSPAVHPFGNHDALPTGAEYANSTLYVFELPLLEQTGVDVEAVSFTTSFDAADPSNTYGTEKTIRAASGFQHENNSNTVTHYSTITTDVVTVQPATIELESLLEDGEDENSTGPSHPFLYQLTVNMEEGVEFDGLTISNELPDNLVYNGGTVLVNGQPLVGNSVSVGGFTVTMTDEPTAGQPNTEASGNNNFTFVLADNTNGTASLEDLIITYEVYIPELDANGNNILITDGGADAGTHTEDAVAIINQASLSGVVDYTGDGASADDYSFTIGADAGLVDDQDGSDDTIYAKALATQKGVSLVSYDAVAGVVAPQIDALPSPGDLLEWSIRFQVSDYYELSNVVINDTFSDGHDFFATVVPTYTIVENGQTVTGTIPPAFYTLTENPDGTATIVFDFSGAAGGQDGILTGDLFSEAGISGETEVVIKFYTEIQENYDVDQVSADRPEGVIGDSIDIGDVFSNQVQVFGTITYRGADGAGGAAGNSFYAEDTSSASIQVAPDDITKSVVAVNGGVPGNTVEVGDTVTYHIQVQIPFSDAEEFHIRDYGDFDNLDLAGLSFSNVISDTPAVGTISLGRAFDLGDNVDGAYQLQVLNPGLVINEASGFFELDFGTFESATLNQVSTIDLYYTVAVSDNAVASGTDVINEAWAVGRTSQGTTWQDRADAVSLDRVSPNLVIAQSVTNINSEVIESFPGQRGVTAISGGNLDDALPGDEFQFQIAVTNNGTDDAFDVAIRNVIPAGFAVPVDGGNLGLVVTDGNGNTLVAGTDYTIAYANDGAGNPTGFTVVLTDNAANGSISDAAAGDNQIFITYNLVVSGDVEGQRYAPNATITQVAAIEGGQSSSVYGQNRHDDAGVTIDSRPVAVANESLANDHHLNNATNVADDSGIVTVDVSGNDTETVTVNGVDIVSSAVQNNEISLIVPAGATVLSTIGDRDQDGSSDVKSFSVPGEGTWTANDNGSITFAPFGSFLGDPTSIQYTIGDGQDEISNLATVTIEYIPYATNDLSSGNVLGTTVVQNILDNDTQGEAATAASVILYDPAGNAIAGNSFDVVGEGTWSYDGAGLVTFSPFANFNDDPTPITYTIMDDEDNFSNQAQIRVDYRAVARDDVNLHNPIVQEAGLPTGDNVTLDVLNNDGGGAPDGNASPTSDAVDPTTVQFTSPPAGGVISDGGRTLTVAGEGVWTVDPINGSITFNPNPGFNNDPSVVSYTVADEEGFRSNVATVTVDYVPVASDDIGLVQNFNDTVEVNVASNDVDGDVVDPTTVQLIGADAGSNGRTLTVAGEGVWSVNAVSGAITFTPEQGLSQQPRPIHYSIEDHEGNVSQARVTILLDTDSDGVANIDDIDDDNDGILDVDEGFSLATGSVLNDWVDLGDGVITDVDGGNIVLSNEADYVSQQNGSTSLPGVGVFVNGFDTANTQGGFSYVYNTPVNFQVGSELVITADYYNAIGNHAGDVNNYIDMPITIHTTQGDLTLNYTFSADEKARLVNNEWIQLEIRVPTVGANVEVTGYEIKIETYVGGVAVGGGFDPDLTEVYAMNIVSVQSDLNSANVTIDSDNDGIADHLDIDKDNDGITDNVEAQSTADYIAPSGQGAAMVDANHDGLDDNYDAGVIAGGAPTGVGLTQVDTDSDGTVDTLDADSDNDGQTDAQEAGHGITQAAIDASADTDNDGLKDVVEGANANDGFDVNDENIAANGNFGLDRVASLNADGSNAISLTDNDPRGTRDLSFRDLNDAPVAVNDSGNTNEDITLVVSAANGLLSNDTDLDGDDLIVTGFIRGANSYAVGTPINLAEGVLTINENGSYTFVPALNFNGTLPAFTYTVSDRNGETATAQLIIIVAPVNDAPVVGDDRFNVNEDNSVEIDVLANDSDVEGDSLSITTVDGQAVVEGIPITLSDGSGTVALTRNGVLVFTAANDYVGPSSFTYVVSDGTDTTQGTVSGVVAPIADRPIITLNGNQHETAQFSGNAGNLVATLGNGDTVTISGGNADIRADDRATTDAEYIQNYGSSLDVLQSDSNSVTTLSFSGGDAPIGTLLAILDVDIPRDSLIITAANGDVIEIDQLESIAGQNSVFPVWNSGSDTLLGNNAHNNNSEVSVFDISGLGDITITTSSGRLVEYAILTPNGHYATTFTEGDAPIAVTDAAGNAIDVEDDIKVMTIQTGAIVDGAAEHVTIASHDFDLTVSETVVALPIGGSSVNVSYDAATGLFTIVNNATDRGGNPLILPQADMDLLLQGMVYENTSEDPTPGDRTLTFVATDATNLESAPAISTITVIPVNDAPITTGIVDRDGVDAQTLTNDPASIEAFSIAGNFSDVEGDALTFSATNLPTGLTMNAAGLISGTIDNSASTQGPFVVTVTAEDIHGDTLSTQFIYNISNPVPLAVDDINGTDEDTAITVDAANGVITPNDSDPDGDDLTVIEVNGNVALVGSTVTGDNGGTFTLRPDGSYDFDPGNAFQDMGAGETRETSIYYTVSDGEGGAAIAQLTITVDGVNDVPVTTGPLGVRNDVDGEPIAPLDTTTAFTIPNGVTLSYSATGLPGGLSIDPVTGEVTGTPDADASVGGPYTVTISGTTPEGVVYSTDMVWNVANPGPVATDDIASTPLDTPVSFTVIGNDTDPDGDDLHIDSVTQPAHGTIILNPDGTITYTPDAGFTGTEVVTYIVSDGQGGTDEGQITIEVGSVAPGTPVVNNPLPDLLNEDAQTININISGNFRDPDGQPLTYTASDLPPGLTIDPDTGVITGSLDHEASVGGPYTVTVTATDPDGHLVSETFVWTVTNPDPIAENDSLTTPVNTPISFNVLSNDHDTDGDVLFVESVTQPSHGTVTVNADGSITYIPTNGYTGQDVFTYTVTDHNGGTDTATVTIGIDNVVPGVPTVDTPIDPQGSFDGDLITVNVSGHFTDPDGQPLVFDATDLPPGLTINPATGLISGDLTPDASQSGPYNVTVTAVDPDGNQVSTTFVWTVENPAPVAVDDNVVTATDTPVTVNVLGNDTDPDGDPLTVTAVTDPANGSVTINPDGTVTYTPNPGYEGVDTFTYTVSDGNGGETTATVTVGIDPGAPVVITPGNLPDLNSVDSQTIISFSVDSAFETQDGSDNLTYSIAGLPAGLMFNSTTGEVSGQLTTDASQAGPYTVVVTATDESNTTATVSFVWTVTNPVPIAVDDSLNIEENEVFTGDLTPGTPGQDRDPDGDVLSVQAINGDVTAIGKPVAGSTGGVFTVSRDGSYSFDPGTDFDHLAAGEVEISTLEYTISDGEGGFDTAVVTATIRGVNDAPHVIDPNNPNVPPANPNSIIPPQSAIDDVLASPINVSQYFADPDNGDVLTFTAQGLPEGLEIDPATGIITGTPASHASVGGPYTVVITATDTHDTSVSTNMIYLVENPAPITMTDFAVVDEDSSVAGDVSINDTDPDDDVMSFIVGTDPTHGIVTMNPDGSFIYTPNSNYNGPDSFTYTAIDADGGSVTETVHITVIPVNDKPVAIVNLNDQENTVQDNVSLDISGNFSDLDGNNLTFTETGLPDGLSIDYFTGVITGTVSPEALAEGIFEVTIIVSDGQGGVVSVGFIWDINPTSYVADDVRAQMTDTEERQNIEIMEYGADGIIVNAVNEVKSLGGMPLETRDVRNLFDVIERETGRLTDSWDVRGLTGFSLRMAVGDSNSETGLSGSDRGQVIVETLVRERTIYIEVKDSLQFDDDRSVTGYHVTMADGRPLPSWLRYTGNGLLIGERPVHSEVIQLKVTANVSDGSTVDKGVTIQTRNGEIQTAQLITGNLENIDKVESEIKKVLESQE